MLFQILLISLVHSECEFPTMSIGNFNITSERQLRDIIKKESIFLLGLTSLTCEKCCESETILNSFVETAVKYSPKIPLMRVDLPMSPFMNKYINYDRESVPLLYGARKGIFYKFSDLPDVMKILRFVDKLISPVHHMTKLNDTLEFLTPPGGKFQSLKILGLFEDKDLFHEYEKAVTPFANWFAADFRAVTDKELVKQVIKARPEIQHMNTLVLMRVDDTKYLDLELPQDMRPWILDNCLALIEELTPFNFLMFGSSTKPMLVMFVDPENQFALDYFEVYRTSARKFENKVRFTFLNGSNPEYLDKRRAIGLGTEILPALAFNSKNGVTYPLPEGLEFSEKTLDSFIQGYLDGKKSTYDGLYHFNGVSLDDCEKVTTEQFSEQVLETSDDVLLLVYSSHTSKDVQKNALNLNRVCKRFKELGFEGLRVRAFDAATQKPPVSLYTGKFPSVFLKGKEGLVMHEGALGALEIMKFAEKTGTKGILLPDLPHLSEEEVEELRRTEEEAMKEPEVVEEQIEKEEL